MSSPIVKSFAALRPKPEVAAQVASVPYAVVNRPEAKALVEGKPLSFLRVGRSEVTLDESVDPYAPEVYAKAKENLQSLIDGGHLVTEDKPALYLYRLTWKGRSQFVNRSDRADCPLEQYRTSINRRRNCATR